MAITSVLSESLYTFQNAVWNNFFPVPVYWLLGGLGKMCLSFLPTNGLASFPGLPRFFCSSVSVDNNTRMRKGGEKRGRAAKNAEVSPPFHIRVLLSTETEEQKKRGRPGNEATNG